MNAPLSGSGQNHSEKFAFLELAQEFKLVSAKDRAAALEIFTSPKTDRESMQWKEAGDVLVRYEAYTLAAGSIAGATLRNKRAPKKEREKAWKETVHHFD